MDERQFLIQQAVNTFNGQFGKQFTVEDFDIFSLPTHVHFDLSYEVYSVRFDDFLRLHMHLIFDKVDELKAYRLETDNTHTVGALGDEVFVTTGKVDSYYRDSGQYRFHPIVTSDAALPVILDETGFGILAESGDFILEEFAN